MLAADVDVRRGTFRLAASVRADGGEVIAVVGPNGCGKSTLLRALAGLAPATGPVQIAGRPVAHLPAYRRPVGWVPQDGALFPHLSAAGNVAFALGGRGGRQHALALLDRVGVADLADRRPHQLSGGQAQRVALARALAREPAVLLLDEPLAALDVAARAGVRRSLREHLRDFAGVTLIVTHDPVDVLTLADRVLALDAGRVVQDAPVAEATRAPRSPWLAELMGSNAYRGRLRGRDVVLAGGGTVTAADVAGPDGGEALAVVPAHAVTLHRDEPDSSARNAWPVVVTDLVVTGSRVRVRCDGAPSVLAEVTPAAVSELGLAEGRQVWASAKATEVTVVLL